MRRTGKILGKMTAFALSVLGATAMSAAAEDTVKIGYIDPLSGGGASVGEGGLKTFQYLADELNAKGGILGHKVEIVPFDNKVNPQESLDSGAEGDRRGHPLSSRRATARRSPPRWRISSPRTTSAIPARKCCTSTTPRSIRR